MKGLIKERVRFLRKNQTCAEKILWQCLRSRNVYNKKFVRQRPIFFTHEEKRKFFVADFYCHENQLVIEVDGMIHERQKDYDEFRTLIIQKLGIRVIRFTNEEILKDLNGVMKKIKDELI